LKKHTDMIHVQNQSQKSTDDKTLGIVIISRVDEHPNIYIIQIQVRTTDMI